MRSLCSFAMLLTLALTGCPAPKNGGGTTAGGGGAGGGLDPDSCGPINTDVGRRLHSFLVATVEIDRQVTAMEQSIRAACKTMGAELQMSPADVDGPTKEMCGRVWTTLQADLQAGLGNQHLAITYKPGVCTVDVDAEARVAAQCEAQASATATVTCEGQCTGTCHGACNGTCAGGAAGGECNGRCDGTCEGSCSGGCTGTSDVHASAECKAQAEVHASATMQCTDPVLTVALPAQSVADQAKAQMALSAIQKGLPKVLWAAARVKPLAHAAESWATAASGLADSAGTLAEQLGEQAICVGGQIAAAAAMVAHIQASVSVSVEVSVQAQGTIGGGT